MGGFKAPEGRGREALDPWLEEEEVTREDERAGEGDRPVLRGWELARDLCKELVLY